MADDIPPYCHALSDRYSFERELGRGGMAIVWLAREKRHDRRVAVKFLRPELAPAMGQERFVREIRYAAKLSHPNILPLLDSGALPDDSVMPGLPYYVMPFVEGESLSDRLKRERPLPIPDAIEIVKDVAAALDHAHKRNLIHRDIKPGNILLTGDAAVVADFGIARAADRAVTSEERTSEGFALGTPQYMPPEQCDGRPDLDGRADIYALGCVLHEMLAGDPPFTGSTPAAVMARQRFDPPPSIRTVRDTVPLAVERAVIKALAKERVDRFATAGEFARALVTGSGEQPAIVVPPARKPVPRWAMYAGAAAAVAIAVLATPVRGQLVRLFEDLFGGGGTIIEREPPLDTTRYAVLPFSYSAEVTAPLLEDEVIRDALARWSGITVADPFQVRDALARRGGGGAPRSTLAAGRIARDVGAGRYVRGEVSRQGDSLRVLAGLYDASNNLLLKDYALRIGQAPEAAMPALSRLADTLLLRGAAGAGAGAGAGPPGHSTQSLPALQAFARGQRAIEQWDLPAADAAFTEASRHDRNYRLAALWTALVRSWSRQPVAEWQSAAVLAASGRAAMTPRDQAISDALVARASGDFPRACRTWTALRKRYEFDFVAWYGEADCLAEDDGVVQDQSSPSGWRFRTSYHAALRSYQRAFQLLPSIHRSLGSEGYREVRRLFKTSTTSRRDGRAVIPDTGRFQASHGWAGDTLAFVPFPLQAIMRGDPQTARRRGSVIEGVRNQRLLFHRVATGWVAAFPTSASALAALALSLEMLGDPSALDTLRRARGLAASAEDSLRLAGDEISLRIRRSFPGDTAGLREARRLADSLLRAHPPGAARDPFLMAGLAALLGRSGSAVAYAREAPVAARWEVPPPLSKDAPALLLFSALGGPADSIHLLERTVAAEIEGALPAGERATARLRWLALGAGLAWPATLPVSLESLAGAGDYLIDAIAAVEGGDTARARGILDGVARARAATGMTSITMDALTAIASLHAAVGQPDQARELVDASFRSLYGAGPEALDDPLMPAGLVRTAVVRAELAATAGDLPTARRWAQAVLILRAGADPHFRPTEQRMRQLAR
jgi:serine/threonine protein kinase